MSIGNSGFCIPNPRVGLVPIGFAAKFKFWGLRESEIRNVSRISPKVTKISAVHGWDEACSI